ncbi:polar amino acid transport system permease protein [Desulforhopalus singaporensis]|uniref:Putative glutamine transport system permease protein GlnP n=1 Tax=Desulforhopalus singaporensis TaxID=91360 RepID=A0A1H0QZ19_9BACT|nr:amino acid ABC transporter permease [Desulforhopalus singaporensis]SDP22345.1 polar amino acid transport system permease protein [Desulforhopalus singaporensis]
MKATTKTWPWKLLLVVILLVFAAGIWGAVQKIDYHWRWNRIPQYFLYLDEEAQKIPFDGTVESIRKVGDDAEVTLLSDNSQRLVQTVAADSINVDEGDLLFEGDTVGFVKEWRIGPLVYGLWTTLWISAVSSVFALILGLLTGLARISNNLTLRGIAITYVECIRGTPLLVQIFIAYFFLGTVFDLSRNVCGIGALALFAGAYVAEIVRAGIQAIPKGQTEAARSLGMNVFQTMADVILPQAFKKIMPPLAGQFISLIKDSSLVSVIAITDLTKSGREIITSTFATFEVWLVVAVMYLLVTSVLSQVVFYMERRFAVSD